MATCNNNIGGVMRQLTLLLVSSAIAAWYPTIQSTRPPAAVCATSNKAVWRRGGLKNVDWRARPRLDGKDRKIKMDKVA